jgi:hypothetical protein
VSQIVAVVAGGDHICTMLAAILLRHKVFARRLQAGSLAQGEPVRRGEAGSIGEPHGKFAVVAAATLSMKGGVSGGVVALSHGVILEARGKNSRRLISQDAQAPAAVQLQAQHRG